MTHEQIEYVRKYGDQLTLQQMADATKLTYGLVRNLCKSLHITPNKSFFQPEGFVVPPFDQAMENPFHKRTPNHFYQELEERSRPQQRWPAKYDNPSHEDILNKYLSMDI